MATIETQGYVNKPEAKKTPGGKEYSVFTLSQRQKNGKDKSGNPKPDTRVFYNCTDWSNASPPVEGSFAKVSGYFSVRDYTTKGDNPVAGKAFDINVQTIEVSPPKAASGAGDSPPEAQSPAKDPWE